MRGWPVRWAPTTARPVSGVRARARAASRSSVKAGPISITPKGRPFTSPAGTATAASTYTVFQATEVLPLQAIIVGRYADTFRREGESGAWRFESRTMRADLTGDLSQHLLR